MCARNNDISIVLYWISFLKVSLINSLDVFSQETSA